MINYNIEDNKMSYLDQIQIKKSNKLAGLHPIAKLWVLTAYIICTMVLGSIKLTQYDIQILYIPLFFVVILLAVASGALKKCLGGLKAVSFVAIVIFVAQIFLIPGGETLFQFGFLKVRVGGLQSAFSIAGMVVCIAAIFVWYLQTTSNKEIARALDEAGFNSKVAYVFTSTLQMINVLGDSSQTIMDAQRARGIETDGNMVTRAKAFVPTLIPLILGALLSSEERVLTLEARGFSMTCEKTHLYNIQKSGLENTAKMVSIIITLVVIAGRIALWVL